MHGHGICLEQPDQGGCKLHPGSSLRQRSDHDRGFRSHRGFFTGRYRRHSTLGYTPTISRTLCVNSAGCGRADPSRTR